MLHIVPTDNIFAFFRVQLSQSKLDKKELQALCKELVNYKVQIEAKAAYVQALLKLQQYNERVGELSSQLTSRGIFMNMYINKQIKLLSKYDI